MQNSAHLQQFQNLVRSNEPPSDNVLIQLQSILAGPEKQLVEIDAQIDRLQDTIYELQKTRANIEKPISEYRCIVSLIRRIPSDILSKIFRHCLPTHRNPTISASEAPMLLTRVCSRWRNVTLSSPRLWSHLHITFHHEVPIKTVYDRTPLETVSALLRKRCDAIKEWMVRSGDCPLHLSIYYNGMSITFDNPPLSQSALLLLKIILSFSSRWKTLELNVPIQVFVELDAMVSTMTIPNLTQVRIIIQDWYQNDIFLRQPCPTLEILKISSLKHISLCNYHMDEIHLFQLMRLTSRNVTHFSFHSLVDLADIFRILESCPQLVHAMFSIITISDYNTVSQRIIQLPFLESLWIVDNSLDTLVSDALYKHIAAPALRWIQHKGPTDIEFLFSNNRFSRQNRPHSISSLVETSLGIRVLELDRFVMAPDTLRTLLEVPSTTFFLNTLCLISPNPTEIKVSALGEIIDPFDLNDLIVQEASDGRGKYVLLPRLEIFELNATLASDDTVFKFVSGRMDVRSPIYTLKKVVILFNRRMPKDGRDIRQEILDRANAAGIQLDLTIQYLDSDKSSSNLVDPLSPSLIRTDSSGEDVYSDGVSWPFDERGQEDYLSDDDG
ncbi:hypothetical protein JR316_0012634 [Psilocybe cubensis]|uniref:Uncharacterized protein n=2 Tax=Psilocybe cubensis TaxID=181762 RepID=A0ACB8GKC7_PSICU|nr:hypothetical protein JR316_0012634 [Psilocybe cubensis]KAH9475519.1 hypothetical protein JR316_0012634 [Psilocybe cubensis]